AVSGFVVEFFKGEGRRADNITERIEANIVAWEAFLENPILGVGRKRLDEKLTGHFGIVVGVHNKWFSTLATNGLIGFLSYLFLFLLSIGRLLTSMTQNSGGVIRETAMGLCVGLIAAMSCLNFYEGFFVELIPLQLAACSTLSSEAASLRLGGYCWEVRG
ncbi:MAG TPA: hypothetical protein EYP19_06145, partial [Desulfobacterales bacterium]|nr:hypothetical protein [Desulfobacterales bacterium]